VTHPIDQLWYAVLKAHFRLIAQQAAGFADVRVAVTNIALAKSVGDLWFHFHPQMLGQRVGYIPNAESPARAYIEDLLVGLVPFQGQHIGLHNVGDVGKVTGL
jgi:hypothetical protein